jgi:DNA-binding NarL/FixJ family response regulator
MGAGRRRRVILAASNSIVAITIADELELAGFEVVGPVGSCAAALTAVQRDAPDVAIIDAVLSDGPGLPVASELAGAGVPFLVLTAWSRSQVPSPEYRGAPWLPLPCSTGAVVSAVEDLLPPGSPSP